MKIGIVTFYNHSNYGAVLQAYALQNKIEDFNHECYHIDFNDSIEKKEINSNTSPILKLLYSNTEKREKNFEDFRKKYINIIDFKDIKKLDKVIVGSDQVWNPSVTNLDSRYFLDFVSEDKRYSYAASFGSKIDDKYKEIFKENLQKFNKISVRENCAKEELNELTSQNVDVVIDPVFLLPKERWELLIKDIPSIDDKYILLIMVQNDINLYKKWQEKAKEEGLLLKVITASYFPVIGFKSWSEISVLEWLRLIYDADLVVTSSFHGFAFSIIFNKKYKVELLTGELENRNIRLLEFANKVDIDLEGEYKESTKLNDYISQSLVFLEDILGENNDRCK